jgi:hypothetical protein
MTAKVRDVKAEAIWVRFAVIQNKRRPHLFETRLFKQHFTSQSRVPFRQIKSG